MFLRWMALGKAERRESETRVADCQGVPVFLDARLVPFFQNNPMRLTAKGFGPLRSVKLAPDSSFSDYVTELKEKVWDSPPHSG